MTKKLPHGLGNRTRDQNPPKASEIRQKRGDTLVGTLRDEYGSNFAPGIRSDNHAAGSGLLGPKPDVETGRCAEIGNSGQFVGDRAKRGQFVGRKAVIMASVARKLISAMTLSRSLGATRLQIVRMDGN